MAKIKIAVGHTNDKYVEKNNFVVLKNTNQFNHRIDYSLTQQFAFVPRLKQDDSEKSVWQYLGKTEHLHDPSDLELTKVAKMLAQIHQSQLKFPPNNLRRRLHTYLKIIHNKNLRVPQIENYYREMISLLAKMKNVYPSHNDVWPENVLRDAKGKLWLVDWEYATLGDFYFDLAFWIESARLSPAQSEVFLTAYEKNADRVVEPLILKRYQRFCHYLTLLWAYAQPEIPFEVDWIKNYLDTNKR
ncbi:phosphotransferase [Mycoplasma sp. ATU-Cv-703]|uniref:phosphotransferase n=1 Tax=Mycoplasma sp. ATU-Cv-703 TaxID=2498595 RepID=UPI0013750F30